MPLDTRDDSEASDTLDFAMTDLPTRTPEASLARREARREQSARARQAALEAAVARDAEAFASHAAEMKALREENARLEAHVERLSADLGEARVSCMGKATRIRELEAAHADLCSAIIERADDIEADAAYAETDNPTEIPPSVLRQHALNLRKVVSRG